MSDTTPDNTNDPDAQADEQLDGDIAQYHTNSIADLADLLRRAEQFHEAYHHEVVAAEFAEAAAFVEDELEKT